MQAQFSRARNASKRNPARNVDLAKSRRQRSVSPAARKC